MNKCRGNLKGNVIVGLALLILFSSVTAETVSHKVVGIVELPSVFGTTDPDGPPGLVPPSLIRSIPIHLHPTSKSPVISEISGPSSVQTKDFDYEAPGAVVYKISEGWVLVRLTNLKEHTFGWVSPQTQGSIHHLADLLKTGLCYIKDWDQVLYQSPGSFNKTKRIKANNERQDVNVVGSVERQGMLWFEVELLGPGRCESEDPEVLTRGWVSGHKKDGNPKIWFYSRGC